MNHRHFSLLRIVTLLFLGLVPILTAAQIQVTVDGQDIVLRDVPPDAWYTTYVRDAVASNIVSGYRDATGNPIGLFGPANSITLAETLKIAVEGAGYDVGAYASVPLTMTGHWALPYLKVTAREQFTVFEEAQDIDRPATRAEVASLFADAFEADTSVTVRGRYGDVASSTPYAASIEALSRDGVLTGDTDNTGRPIGRFRPLDDINRAEVTKMVMVARATYGTQHRGSSSSVSSGAASSASSQTSFSSLSSVSSSLASSASSAGASSSPVATVRLTETGFSPRTVTVQSGATIRFTNDSTGLLRVASDPHPLHTDYPGFDSLTSFERGESYAFTFRRAGTWGFHNHANPTMTGSVVVQ